MIQRLQKIEAQYEEVGRQLALPSVATNPAELQRLGKERARLEGIVTKFRKFRSLTAELEEARSLGRTETDPEMRDLAAEEIASLEPEVQQLEEELKLLLLPRDPNDEKNVILEIRAGTGGEEAALFAGHLLRMYSRYAERHGWDIEPVQLNAADMGGVKEAVVIVKGAGAFSKLKFESGVHRVQRVPVTEASGRVHTSAATVAVLPEAEEVDVEVDPTDLEIESYRASGPGGQHMQKNETAVRITHKPTGLVVACQDERSQLQNREKALRFLRSQLLEARRREQEEKMAQARKKQVRGGDRSEKIRTYNFPQNRLTDHRIGFTLYALESVMDGGLDALFEALAAEERAGLLAAQEVDDGGKP